MTTAIDQADRILRPRAVAAYLGVSKRTINRMRRRGEFPEPIRISPGAVGWRLRDVESYVSSRAPKEAA